MNDYPTSLNTHKTDWANTTPVADTHPEEHNDIANAVTALEAKVGADSSAVTTSHDYKLGGVTGSDKAASLTGSETLTNKTLTSPVLNGTITGTGVMPVAQGGTGQATATEGFDALAPTTTNGDLIYYNGSDNVRLPIGSAGQTLQVTGGIPTWGTATVDPADSVDSISVLHLDTNIENDMSIFQDDAAKMAATEGSTTIAVDITGQSIQRYDMTNHWASANLVSGIVLLGSYIYVLLVDTDPATDVRRVYRLNKSDITTASQITFSGQSLTDTNSTVRMTSDGTDLYFTYDSGNSANDYAIAKFTVSGTTFTYDSTITCGSTANLFDAFAVTAAGNIYAYDVTARIMYKYNSSGTLQDTGDAYKNLGTGSLQGLLNWNDNFFVCHEDTTNFHAKYMRVYYA